MSLIVSGVFTLKRLGVSLAFLTIWRIAWFLSWLGAFPTLPFVLPLVRQVVGLMVEPAPK
jgi:hypothetical protein